MLNTLHQLLPGIASLTHKPGAWNSLIINRRKPYTYRIFTMIGDIRVCLHKFDECNGDEAFMHPHPWPGAFMVLGGAYYMKLGNSIDREHTPTCINEFYMNSGSAYEIVDELTWHSVAPVCETYTVMINGAPFEHPHKDVRTTKGKDLERMSHEDLLSSLKVFQSLFSHNSKIQGINL